MPNLNANETVTQKHVRNFIQFGGPSPANGMLYAGQDAQYMRVEGVKVPDGQGKIEPIWVQDPRRAGRYRMVGRKISPPELAEATLVLTEKHGSIPRQLARINCAFNLYENIGVCKDLSDPLTGWTDYVLVYSGMLVDGSKTLGNRSSQDGDNQLEDSLPGKLVDIYPVGALGFGDNAQSVISLEVIDAVYGSSEQCGDCGPLDDGTQRIYAVTKSSGSTPGTPPRVIYSVNGGVTWATSTITGIGDTEDPVVIEVVGKYLLVATRTAGGATTSGYYYAEVNTATGVPGTWTPVTSGFLATFQIYDCLVLSPREVFFSADGGAIYKSTDITTGVELACAPGTVVNTALRRISGNEETLVAVGGSGTVVVSINRGKTWGTALTSPVVATLQALYVLDANIWWVGTSNGTLWYTLNAGASWAQKRFSGDGAGQLYDIVFVNREVGYFSHSTATPTARIFSTWNGGRDWTNGSPRVNNVPTANRFNRVNVPFIENAGIAANTVIVAGLAGGGTDGILLQGIASRL